MFSLLSGLISCSVFVHHSTFLGNVTWIFLFCVVSSARTPGISESWQIYDKFFGFSAILCGVCTTAADKFTLSSLYMSSLTFEQWSMFPWSFPKQFLWWNCQVLASATSRQTAVSCNFHRVLFSFLWNAFLCSPPSIPFLIRIDNLYYNFSSTVLPCIMTIFLQGPILPCSLQRLVSWFWDCWNNSLLLHGQNMIMCCVSFAWSLAHPGD